MIKIFTIGFTKTSARNFFGRLSKSGAKKLIDVRLNNVSQLAGFAKRDDLEFFAHELCRIRYQHMPQFAPTKDILDDYKKRGKMPWEEYEERFLKLIEQRQIEKMSKDQVDGGCFLCSEDKPHHCHRRLVAEYLKKKWGDVEILHL